MRLTQALRMTGDDIVALVGGGGKTTAMFLIWLEGKYGPELVPKLNAALRRSTYSDALFQELTGKEVAPLWSDFAAAAPAPSQTSAQPPRTPER